MMDLEEYLGCIYGWTWNGWYLTYEWIKLYWPAPPTAPVRSQNAERRPLVRLAGHPGRRRGRHWDRRRSP